MRTVNKFIFTGLFFVLAVCAFAQAQDSIVHADTTVITAQDVTVVPPDSLKAADSLQVMTDTVPPKKTKVYLIHSNTLSFDKANPLRTRAIRHSVTRKYGSARRPLG